MSKFIITYRNGTSEAVISDAESCEAQANATFGTTLEEAREFGANVEFADKIKHAFNEDEFLKGDPSGELKNATPVGEPRSSSMPNTIKEETEGLTKQQAKDMGVNIDELDGKGLTEEEKKRLEEERAEQAKIVDEGAKKTQELLEQRQEAQNEVIKVDDELAKTAEELAADQAAAKEDSGGDAKTKADTSQDAKVSKPATGNDWAEQSKTGSAQDATKEKPETESDKMAGHKSAERKGTTEPAKTGTLGANPATQAPTKKV